MATSPIEFMLRKTSILILVASLLCLVGCSAIRNFTLRPYRINIQQGNYLEEDEIDRIEAGLRLRYEFAREFAPYIGISQEWRIGGSADYVRAEGEDPSVTNYVVGVRFWF